MSRNYKFLNPEGLYFVIFYFSGEWMTTESRKLKAESRKLKAESRKLTALKNAMAQQQLFNIFFIHLTTTYQLFSIKSCFIPAL